MSNPHWLFYSHKLLPTLDEMVQHFDNYSDLLQGLRHSGSLTTYDLALDASEDSFQAFRRRGHTGLPAPAGPGETRRTSHPPEFKHEYDRYQWDGHSWVKNGEVHLLPVVKVAKPKPPPVARRAKPKPRPEPPPPPPPPPPPEPHIYDTDDVAWVEAITEKLITKFGWHEAPARLRAHREVSGYWRRDYERRLHEHSLRYGSDPGTDRS